MVLDSKDIKMCHSIIRRCIIENTFIIICYSMLIGIIGFLFFINPVIEVEVVYTIVALILGMSVAGWIIILFCKMMDKEFRLNLKAIKACKTFIDEFDKLQKDETTKFRTNINDLLDEY